MYLIPIQHPDEPPPHAECWETYAVSEDQNGETCDFLQQLEDLDETFSSSFYAWLLHFKKLCAAQPKRPLETLIQDKKKLHDVGRIRLQDANGTTSEQTVWQFTHDRIRVMWCYANDGRILILGRVLIKKGQKVRRADVDMVERFMQRYLNAKAAGVLTIVRG